MAFYKDDQEARYAMTCDMLHFLDGLKNVKHVLDGLKNFKHVLDGLKNLKHVLGGLRNSKQRPRRASGILATTSSRKISPDVVKTKQLSLVVRRQNACSDMEKAATEELMAKLARHMAKFVMMMMPLRAQGCKMGQTVRGDRDGRTPGSSCSLEPVARKVTLEKECGAKAQLVLTDGLVYVLSCWNEDDTLELGLCILFQWCRNVCSDEERGRGEGGVLALEGKRQRGEGGV
eukprot:365775-Chlamydomonas_euryale.AAC.12